MDSLTCPSRPARGILGGLLLCGAFCAGESAWAQTTAPGQGRPPSRDVGAAARANPDAGRRDPSPAPEKAQAPDPKAPQAQTRREPSEAFRQSLRQTIEKRRQRRARRALGQGLDDARRSRSVPWLYVAIIVLLCIEWFSRRRAGLR